MNPSLIGRHAARPPWLLLLTLAALVGCERVDSTHVATHEIEAHVEVVSDGYGATEITARLELDGGHLTYVQLAEGDALSVEVDGVVRRMTAEPGFTDYLEYTAAVDVAWGPVAVTLHRPHWPSATLYVDLPEPFDLYRLPGSYALGEDVLPIRWSRPDFGEARLSVQGPCVHDTSRTVRDTGQHDLYPGDLAPRASWDGGVCQLEIQLERIDRGTVDARLADGSVVARQVRSTGAQVWR